MEEVASFEYFRATLSKDGTCRAEIRIQIATATAVMARLNSMWKSNISFQTKFQLFRLLVVSILLYRYETWTLLVDNKRRIQAFETKCLRKLLCISYKEHKTRPITVRSSVKSLMDPREPLLAIVRQWKVAWFGCVMRHNTLSNTITHGTVKGGDTYAGDNETPGPTTSRTGWR